MTTVLAGWGTIRLVDWWTEWPARTVLRAGGELYPGPFSPDGTTLATRAFPAEDVILWDLASGRERATWHRPDQRRQFAGAFSPDGRTYAAPWFLPRSGKNFSVDLIDVATGQVRSTVDSPHGGFLGLRFRGDGATVRLLAAGSGTISAVDFHSTSGEVMASRTVAATMPTGFYGSNVVSGDARYLALSSAGAARGSTSLSIWDLDRDAEAFPIPGDPGGPALARVAFSADGHSLAVAREDGSIELWDLATRSRRWTTPAHGEDFASVNLGFSPDGSTLASTGNLHRMRTLSLDFARAVLAHYLAGPDPADRLELVLLEASTGRRLRSSRRNGLAVFSPDGRTLATSHDDGTIKLYDLPRAR